MIKKTYALYDTATMVFLNSLTFINDGEAIRWAQCQVDGDPQSNAVAKFPEQYILYRLQDFDDKTGQYIPRDQEKIKDDDIAALKTHSMPKEVIPLISLKKEADRVFTVEELIRLMESKFETKTNTVKAIKEA